MYGMGSSIKAVVVFLVLVSCGILFAGPTGISAQDGFYKNSQTSILDNQVKKEQADGKTGTAESEKKAGSEYNDKAEWLEKFTRYIEWPEKTGISDITKPFVIGVIGQNPFGTILDDVYAPGKMTIKKKKVVIKYFSEDQALSLQLKSCHLLFVRVKGKKIIKKILSNVKKEPILTVGDTPGFARKGIHINFSEDGEKLHFEINPNALQKASLSAAPSFLRIGKLVTGEER